jgi:uncharacterized membrane protein (DUF106 family)
MIKEYLIANPKVGLLFISIFVTLVMTIVTKYTTNQDRMKELKGLQKACQIKLKENKHDQKIQSEVSKQMMECSMEMIKYSFRPMFITLLPLLGLFWWLREVYAETIIASSWIWWYIGFSIIGSMIFRKVLKVV